VDLVATLLSEFATRSIMDAQFMLTRHSIVDADVTPSFIVSFCVSAAAWLQWHRRMPIAGFVNDRWLF
jgi:hypothetical protein